MGPVKKVIKRAKSSSKPGKLITVKTEKDISDQVQEAVEKAQESTKQDPTKLSFRGKKKTKNVDRLSFIDGVVQDIKKVVSDKEDVTILSKDILPEVKEWLPTGFKNLDNILGGGWPVGRISEVFGREGSGKSALTHMAVKTTLDMGGIVFYIDVEHSLDPDKMEQMNIDTSRVVYATPKDVEEVWDVLWAFLNKVDKDRPNCHILVVWDSIGASIPRSEWGKMSGDKTPGGIGQAMSKGCRKAYRRVPESGIHFMMVNQVRKQFGGDAKYGTDEITVGGNAVLFAATIRLRVSRRSVDVKIKGDKRKIGYFVRSRVEKNKIYPPHQECEWVLDFTDGPSPELTMFYYLLNAKVIKSVGKGFFGADWSASNFTKKQWVDLLKNDKDFKRAAESVYDDAITAKNFFVVTGGNADDTESDDSE